jgi:hypothetical protein
VASIVESVWLLFLCCGILQADTGCHVACWSYSSGENYWLRTIPKYAAMFIFQPFIDADQWEGFSYVAALFFAQVIQSFALHKYFFIGYKVGMQVLRPRQPLTYRLVLL